MGEAKNKRRAQSDAVRKYVAERDAILRDMDVDAMIALSQRHMPAQSGQPDRQIVLAGMHKARIAITTMPDDLKEQSRLWLVAHGYRTSLDGMGG